jgi:ubiquinone/menaquinone biosynthesis C-methylase UbiE
MALVTRLKSALRSLIGVATPEPDSSDPLDAMIPTAAAAAYVGGGDRETFKTIGRMNLERLRDLAGLTPHEHVLEVGCGIGRMAIPLTQYLDTGRYVGFDIVERGIEWCRSRVTSRYPNFTFLHADVYNKKYNRRGKNEAHRYTFPFADRSFDVVFLTSVFTHMLPRDVERYTAEIGRVLRPGGRCYCTAYLITAEARDFLARGASVNKFRESADGYWAKSPRIPEAAIGFTDEYLFSTFGKAGMEIQRVVPGEWWSQPSAQDVFIALKRAA